MGKGQFIALQGEKARGLVSGGLVSGAVSLRAQCAPSSSAGQPRHPHPAPHKHAFPQLPFPTDVCAGIDREASSSPSNSWGVRAVPPAGPRPSRPCRSAQTHQCWFGAPAAFGSSG